MREHFPTPNPDREIDRIELDVAPFLRDYEDQEEGAWELSEFTKRINAELSKRAIYVALYDGNKLIDEPANHQGIRRAFDEEHINNAILKATRRRSVIDDAAARVIASQIYAGQDSPLYALTSTGAIADGLLESIDYATKDPLLDPLARAWAKELEQYVMVRIQSNEWAAVKGWNQLWLGGES